MPVLFLSPPQGRPLPTVPILYLPSPTSAVRQPLTLQSLQLEDFFPDKATRLPYTSPFFFKKKKSETCRTSRSDAGARQPLQKHPQPGLCRRPHLTSPLLPQRCARLSPRHATATTTWTEARASPWARSSCTGARTGSSWWVARGSPACAGRALRPGATPRPTARVRTPPA